jgi:hypothetical protein
MYTRRILENREKIPEGSTLTAATIGKSPLISVNTSMTGI